MGTQWVEPPGSSSRCIWDGYLWKGCFGVPVVAQWKWIWLGTMTLQVLTRTLLSGLRIWCCHELWCRSQTCFGSGVAVAVVQAGNYISNSTPSLGTSRCDPKKQKRKKKKERKGCLRNQNFNTNCMLIVRYLNITLFLIFARLIGTK